MSRRFRLTVTQKMFLGYVPLVLLLFALGIFALVSLARLNGLARDIVEVDVPLSRAMDRLSDVLLTQNLYGRRFLILRDQSLADVFWRQSAEFQSLLETVRARRGSPDEPVERVASLHRKFDFLFAEAFSGAARGMTDSLDRNLKDIQRALSEAIQAQAVEYRKSRDGKIGLGAAIGNRAFIVTAILCALGVLVGGGAAFTVARRISHSLRTLKEATRLVADRRFDQVPKVEGRDELADLLRAFESMARQLKRMEATCLDANPLTRLPGGMAIENLLRRRLELRWPLAFCLLDLDNFKAYSDKYGYARGSEVLTAVARLLEEVVAEKGSEQDFVGHIGGDDFILMTTTGRYEGLCNSVIERFDAIAPGFYDRADRERGYIAGKTRQGETAEFPLMTISIAVVTNPGFRLRDPIEFGEMAAQLKARAKSIPGSVYVTEGSGEPSSEGAGGDPA